MTRGSFNDVSSNDGNGGWICTESQMMAMFGWTASKMPAHYIAQANPEKLGMSGMDEIVAFSRSMISCRCRRQTAGTSVRKGVEHSRVTSAKKRRNFKAKRG
jgi:hypothetical protein